MPAGYSLHDFSFDLRRHMAPDNVWLTSGWTSVQATAGTVCGVGGCFAPPYAAPDSSLTVTLEVDGRQLSDGVRPGIAGFGLGLLTAGGTWRPDRVERRGTFHQYDGGRLVSLAVESRLTPLYGAGGYILEIVVENRADRDAEISLQPRLVPGRPGRVPLADWGWMQPQPDDTAGVEITLHHDHLHRRVPAGARTAFTLTVELGETAAGPADTLETAGAGSVARAQQATGRWERRLAAALEAVPRLETDIPGLAAYWRRSIASGLVCLWDNPAFVTNPFVATSGVDGGALCAYVWDTGGYAPHLLTLMLSDTATDLLEAMLTADLAKHYAIAPDGAGLGVAYAYSGWSLVNLASAVASHRGLTPHLAERLHDAVAALDARFPAAGELRDYGTQQNLLEMRGAGWEHVVASPNAERAASLDALATLAETTGAALPVDALRATAHKIRAAVAEELWDADAKWFRSRYPDGHTELAYSVQAFDALRAGACTPQMAADLVARIREGAFLGAYGVSSVSAEDERHYELGDTDWSGGGAYTGEAPLLALTLWERGEAELAWTVLSRLLWMGTHYPYFPQEHYSDRPAAPPTGRRANIVAGLAGAEAILVGLAGVRPQPDGRLVIAPPPAPGHVTLRGLRFRGRSVDVECRPDGFTVTVDGEPVHPDGGVVTVRPR
jgi:Mannosylglycerate hydrolase MGH1-like glycoside hydrolase domain